MQDQKSIWELERHLRDFRPCDFNKSFRKTEASLAMDRVNFQRLDSLSNDISRSKILCEKPFSILSLFILLRSLWTSVRVLNSRGNGRDCMIAYVVWSFMRFLSKIQLPKSHPWRRNRLANVSRCHWRQWNCKNELRGGFESHQRKRWKQQNTFTTKVLSAIHVLRPANSKKEPI